MNLQRVDVSWSKWNEYKDFKPRYEKGIDWYEYRWAWFRVVITPVSNTLSDRQSADSSADSSDL